MNDTTLGREWLQSHLPHRGAMNLLDGIVRWDSTSIVATATGHRSAGNPLRRAAELPIAAGIEYAAQAAAAHGALASGKPSPGGLLASARSVAFHASRLDDIAAPLEIVAEQVGADGSGALYRFAVLAAGTLLVEGRVAVAFVK